MHRRVTTGIANRPFVVASVGRLARNIFAGRPGARGQRVRYGVATARDKGGDG
jgi:hypothetical protein